MTANPEIAPVAAPETEEQLTALGEATTWGMTGFAVKTIFVIGVAFSVWQIYTAAYSPLSSLVMRSIHVGFLLLMTFLLYRVSRNSRRDRIPWYDWILAVASFALGLYHWFFEIPLIQRDGDPTIIDLAVGAAVVLLLFEAARRIMGWPLVIMCAVFIPYALLGRYLPQPFLHRGYDLSQIIQNLYLGTEGIYGITTLVSSTYIFLFVLFGAFLEKAGVIGLFNDVAMGLFGHTQGGPAKVAVFSSGLMGTINGSGVANVVTTGQFTIPLMIRFGYRPAFAGAVEATASMGGQIMPPVMGAVAFIMAETINVPYVDICIAAAIPAMLYYAAAFAVVHFEAGRYGLKGLSREQRPDVGKALRERWHLLIPLVGLVYLIFGGYTPLFAGTVSTAITIIFILGSVTSVRLPSLLVRLLFWVAIGVAAALLFDLFNVTALFVMIGLLAVAAATVAAGRGSLMMCVQALSDGARSALPVGVACALVGVLIGIMQLTSLGPTLSRIILDQAGHSLFLTLFYTMIISIVLGTGLPTIPTYIITASMAAPILFQMGIPLIVSHMFVFYFGIMADLTPPVALAAFAASVIAKADAQRIGWIATRIAVAGYIIPFMAVYDSSLMLQTGTWLDTAYVTVKAMVALIFWGAAMTGWFVGALSILERVFLVAVSCVLVASVGWLDEIGLALSAAFVVWHVLRSRAPRRSAA